MHLHSFEATAPPQQAPDVSAFKVIPSTKQSGINMEINTNNDVSKSVSPVLPDLNSSKMVMNHKGGRKSNNHRRAKNYKKRASPYARVGRKRMSEKDRQIQQLRRKANKMKKDIERGNQKEKEIEEKLESTRSNLKLLKQRLKAANAERDHLVL